MLHDLNTSLPVKLDQRFKEHENHNLGGSLKKSNLFFDFIRGRTSWLIIKAIQGIHFVNQRMTGRAKTLKITENKSDFLMTRRP